ncbi:hypothetical protein W911_05750 [Hyphomicrobium nitrativorans NL23]|uniref:Uncharacterized protein n=1 Tax=Hyphomicrobium nitrativorans NL23 TaxID=1029756 RepID=V5SJ71_9HYPH|nr:hypothetical protein W911_05750 [Hyphomicrobium nitrativorans NL23]
MEFAANDPVLQIETPKALDRRRLKPYQPDAEAIGS